MFAALADRVDAPAIAGFGAAGGTGVAACAAGGGESPQPLTEGGRRHLHWEDGLGLLL